MENYSLVTTGLMAVVLCVHAQNIPEFNICNENLISPSVKFGKIVHKQENVNTQENCSLEVQTLSSQQYKIFKGVNDSDSHCPEMTPVVIDNTKYCAVSSNGSDARMYQSGMAAYIFTPRGTSSFSFYFFNNVIICGEGVPEYVGAFTGVISSPNPESTTTGKYCSVWITELPANTDVLVYSIGSLTLNGGLSIKVGETKQITLSSKEVIINTGNDGDVKFQCSQDTRDGDPEMGFHLFYNLIRCGDIPRIDLANYTEIPAPYLPGSTVQYQCADSYHFKGANNISCIRNGSYANWDTSIMCTPVPWCVKNPAQISNTYLRDVTLNITKEYRCLNGYEASGSFQSIIIECTSENAQTIPLSWNDTDVAKIFICLPVQCNVSDIRNITNGNVLTVNNTLQFDKTVSYKCSVGYEKVVDEDIRCLSNKTWSAFPRCNKVRCQALANIPNAVVTPNLLLPINHPYGTVFNISCEAGYEMKYSGNQLSIKCHSNRKWVLTDSGEVLSEATSRSLCQITPSSFVIGQEPGGKKGLSKDEVIIIVVVIGALVLAAVIAGAAFFVRWKRNNLADPSPGKDKSGDAKNDNQYAMERPDVIPSSQSQVINHSEGAYAELETTSEPPTKASKKSSKKNKNKDGAGGPSEEESPADPTGPMYAAVTPKMKTKRPKPAEPNAADAGPIYEPAPAVPVRNHGEQEPELVENDLYEQTPGNAAVQSTDNVAFVDNDLYDSKP